MTKKELLAENERLRRQIVDLHAEVTILRAQQVPFAPAPAFPSPWQRPGSRIIVGDVPPYTALFIGDVLPCRYLLSVITTTSTTPSSPMLGGQAC